MVGRDAACLYRGATSAGQATPTQLYDPKANSYFYAVATLDPVTQQPGTLNLLYDYLLRTVPVFIEGQTVARISLPLADLEATAANWQFAAPWDARRAWRR